MLRRADAARRVAAQRLPVPGSTLIALVVFGLVATMVAGLAAFAGTSPGAPSPESQPAAPGTVQPPSPTATPAPPSGVPLVDASSVRRASLALGVRVDPTPTWRPLGANLAAYTQATGQVRLQFESGAAYVSLINVAHRRGTVSDERQLVALLALADVARSAEQEDPSAHAAARRRDLPPETAARSPQLRCGRPPVLAGHRTTHGRHPVRRQPAPATQRRARRRLPLQHAPQRPRPRRRPRRAVVKCRWPSDLVVNRRSARSMPFAFFGVSSCSKMARDLSGRSPIPTALARSKAVGPVGQSQLRSSNHIYLENESQRPFARLFPTPLGGPRPRHVRPTLIVRRNIRPAVNPSVHVANGVLSARRRVLEEGLKQLKVRRISH